MYIYVSICMLLFSVFQEVYVKIHTDIYVDGQVCLIHLKMDNFSLFLRQQKDKRQTSVWTMSKQVNILRKIVWTSIFLFLFDVSVSISPHLHFSISMSLCLHVSMSPCLDISGIPKTENGIYGKRQLLFIFCKQKTGTVNFRLFAAIRKENGRLFSLVEKW